MAETGNHSIGIESGAPNLVKLICSKPIEKGPTAIYLQEIIRDVTLFTSQSTAKFYDKTFSN